MRKLFALLLCLTFFVTFDVKALGMLPSIILAIDNTESIAIEFSDGEYVLPEFCSTLGCTVYIDRPSLIAIGKVNYDNNEEYFHISDGGGAIINDVSADNYNEILIDAVSFNEYGFVTIDMGALDEKRTLKLVSYKKSNVIDNNQSENQVVTATDTEMPIINNQADTDNNINTTSKLSDKNLIIYILIFIGILSVVSAAVLLIVRKKQLSNM